MSVSGVEMKYEVTHFEGIRELLNDYYRIDERKYLRGDFGAADLLIDTDLAVDVAGLTKRQRIAIELVKSQYTLTEISEHFGVTPQTADESIRSACEKIAVIFRQWNEIAREVNGYV
jgi:DNA-directed RNA polymerase specialized sigma24 family protein